MTEENKNARLGIGGNSPPDPIDEALAPYSDDISEAENWLDGEPVENEDQLKATDALLKKIKAALKDLNAARDSETKPLHDAWKAEIARWKPTQTDLEKLRDCLVACQGPFKKKLAEQKEAEKREAWEAAEKARKEAEAAAMAASASNIEAHREAAEKKEAALKAQKEASAKQKDKVKGMRTVHHHKITDHRAALHWIAKNDRDEITKFIEAYVSKNFRQFPIEGVETWEEKEAF